MWKELKWLVAVQLTLWSYSLTKNDLSMGGLVAYKTLAEEMKKDLNQTRDTAHN